MTSAKCRLRGKNGLAIRKRDNCLPPTMSTCTTPSWLPVVAISCMLSVESLAPSLILHPARSGRCRRQKHCQGQYQRPGILQVPLDLLKEPEEATSDNLINPRQANTNSDLFSPPFGRTDDPLRFSQQSSSSSSSSSSARPRRNNPRYYENADQRYQASDWWEILKSLPTSTILQATKWPVLTVMAWSVLLSAIHCTFACIGYTGKLAQTLLCPIPSTIPHAATVTALGLLLVFRTTTAYQKFDEGRHIWEHILSISRNLTRLIYLYPEFTPERRVRIFQLLAAYPFFLHCHVTSNQDAMSPESNGNADGVRTTRLWKPVDAIVRAWHNSGPLVALDTNKRSLQSAARLESSTYIDRYALPWSMFPDQTVRSAANSSNRPLWACDRMAQEILSVSYTDRYTSMERAHFLWYIGQLSEAVGECERIQRTAVPLNYARHSLRGLTLWLFTLPLALIHSFGWWTAPVMGLAAWLMYGIYQIGYSIEDPFQGSLRLATLCDGIFRDVMCDSRRATAFNVSMGEYEEWKDLPL
jgi:predicted membrane chloride channel (bestrophin family)